MSKKRLLFMTHGLPIGGIESALLSMLKQIDYETYRVDLLLVAKEGERLNEVPKQVTVRSLKKRERYFFEQVHYSIKNLRLGADFTVCIKRIYYSFKLFLYRKQNKDYDIWEDFLKNITPMEQQYDVAIDYDGFCNRYILKKVNAKKKIMWNHFNYKFFSKDVKNDFKYFSKFVYIVTISEKSADSLKYYFKKLEEKIVVIPNILDVRKIKVLSLEKAEDIPKTEKNSIKICSVGRLNGQKDFMLSISAASYLKQAGISFVWYVVGEGTERINLERKIKENDLEEEFLLLGKRKNPYPYMKVCDIYVQTSLFEGLCVAVSEAKILCKPIIVVDVQGLREQVDNGKNGLVTERKAKAVAEAIVSLDQNQRNYFSKNLLNVSWQDNESMHKFYQICEN